MVINACRQSDLYFCTSLFDLNHSVMALGFCAPPRNIARHYRPLEDHLSLDCSRLWFPNTRNNYQMSPSSSHYWSIISWERTPLTLTVARTYCALFYPCTSPAVSLIILHLQVALNKILMVECFIVRQVSRCPTSILTVINSQQH